VNGSVIPTAAPEVPSQAVLYLGYLAAPIFGGSVEQQREAIGKLKSVDIVVVASLSLSRKTLVDLASACKQLIDQIDEMQHEETQE